MCAYTYIYIYTSGVLKAELTNKMGLGLLGRARPWSMVSPWFREVYFSLNFEPKRPSRDLTQIADAVHSWRKTEDT